MATDITPDLRERLGISEEKTDEEVAAALNELLEQKRAEDQETASQSETDEENLTRQAEVCCSGVSYFTTEKVLNANGEPRKDKKGDEITFEKRHEAFMGDVITLSTFEFDRLEALGAVQVPGSKPLPGSPGTTPKPTPFGVPLPDPETGELKAWEGPVMGQPEPHGPGTDDRDIVAGPRPLTTEEAAELEARARGEQDPDEGPVDAGLYDSYMELDKEDLKEEAKTEGLTVTREDGRTDLEPTKSDYARALAEHAEAQEGIPGRQGGGEEE